MKGNHMETTSLKALAIKTLEGNQEGNQQETKSFPRGIQEGNSGKSFPVELPRVGNQETLKSKPTKALGYGCAGCGNRMYQAVQAWELNQLPETAEFQHEHKSITHWKCQGCGTVFQWIGGSQGPTIMA
jgi:hypothetical protein